ncbi:MAG: efflux RND transporter periplasmic adaptor subunit [Verrucomicrobiales bacterium]|nr:efflux RND transporter periplasmic adaptor subunit [Verrucomicrobiales bacterium]
MASNKPGKTRKIVVAVILLLSLAGLGTWALLRKREPVITVQTETVARRNLTELVVATGKIQAVTKVVINPEVSGEIVELPVREGQTVKQGDLLVRIKPDPYIANRNSADATYRSSLAGVELSKAELEKAKLEFARFEKLFREKLVSESDFLTARTSLDVAQARHESSRHQSDQAKAALAKAEEDLLKTTILAPIDGTIVNLKSERGERVVGTAMMAGTEIMTVAQLAEMEARVDVGEIDVVLVQIGQKARLEVDSYRDRKFNGVVTEIANAARTQGLNTQQEATKFEVRIRVQEKEIFRPGMSVTAEIETRYRSNVLTAPLQSVTTRLPKEAKEQLEAQKKQAKDSKEEEEAAGNQDDASGRRRAAKSNAPKPIEVVFAVKDGKCVMNPVTRGISDDNHVEITSGLEEGLEIVSGGYKAINRELEDGKAIKVDNTVKAFTRRDEEKKP